MKQAMYEVTFGYKNDGLLRDNALSVNILAEHGDEALTKAKEDLNDQEGKFYLSSIKCLARES